MRSVWAQGFGAVTSPFSTFADRDVIRLSKGGKTPGGKAGVWHWAWQEHGGVHSVSFADSCTGPNYIDSTACVPFIETLQREGYLDTDVDLFPAYGIDLD